VASVATLKFMKAEVSLSCDGIERFLGEEDSRVHALRGVSLQLERGTVHAVVGPSGCGKSTLLYILGLLDHADSGWVTIEDEAVSHLVDDALAQKRNELLGFIFQFHFLLEDFTAQENVMIPMRRLNRLTESEMLKRSEFLLEEVGLGEKAGRPSRHLSGANSQRAFELLQRIVQEERKALLLVTHNPEIAEACDWIHEMQDGLIVGSHPRGRR
jgi:lipoprotein-releasing system ATP-binding protein